MIVTFKYTLGCDPEFFVRDLKTRLIVPVCGKMGGTKKEPRQFEGMTEGYKYQEDNVSFELNIPKTYDANSFYNCVTTVVNMADTLLRKNGLSLVKDLGSSNRFRKQELLETPLVENDEGKKVPQAMLIGCDPDYRAYGPATEDDPFGEGTERKVFNIDILGTVRHVGGHIHFGYNKDLIPDHVFVRLVDAFVYLPWLDKDKQTSRRPFYGLAGLYRPKPYGIEYRSMSNFWTLDNSVLEPITSRCASLLQKYHESPHDLAEAYAELPHAEIRDTIDAGGSDNYVKLMQQVNAIWKTV